MESEPIPGSGLPNQGGNNQFTESTSGVISRAPVHYNQDNEGKKTELNAVPPQLQSNPFQNQIAPKAARQFNPAQLKGVGHTKSTLADWVSTQADDDWVIENAYPVEKPQRGGRKKRKKQREEVVIVTRNWDDIYDPTRPNVYEDYRKGDADEKIREIRDWKNLLHAHRTRRSPTSDRDDYPRDTRFAPPQITTESLPPPQQSESAPANPGEDAYARREQMSQIPNADQSMPDYPPSMSAAQNDEEIRTEQPRSNRPGQEGFAKRLLMSQGWKEGTGLGATGSGIVKPLQVKIDKRKKRPDSEGGGFMTPAGRGTIIGGKRKAEDDVGKFGVMSQVIIIRGMLDGFDLEKELDAANDGGVIQEIGDEFNKKYGNVERVYIARDTPAVPVFVKFTGQVSALQAVNALEGGSFRGNNIIARFFDSDKFERGIYEE
ncbi:G-patch DNA repair protein [Penicillium taxi]|uniref:G-patch DNA repair protein n=1 Tax=Penicillium taxi TaxID=168475 RepID=UPI00254564CA|nr:G-patch DNA repair protein [Penicillium taxi]KAJ5907854.1 G-patch DNA repair protein [Penicillium taxi]